MNSKKYLVLGAGMGQAITLALVKNTDTRLVVVGDMNTEKAFKVSDFVNKNSNSRANCIPMNFEAEVTRGLVSIFRQFDVVVSALPAKYNPSLAEIAIRSDVHFCDLGGVIDATGKIMGLNTKYPHMKSSIIPDCGLMPGLGLILLQKLFFECVAQNLKPENAIIYVGGIPQKLKPPVFYQPMFSIEGLAHLCFDKAPILRKGQIIWSNPFSEYEQLSAPELVPYSGQFHGRIEAFITSGASVAPWNLQKLGFKEFCEKTIRLPGFVEFVKTLTQENFEEKMKTIIHSPINTNNPDLVWMKVMISGKDWSKNTTLLDLFDPKTGLTAMQRTTGFTTAVIAEMVAEGKTKQGVHTPESAFEKSEIDELIYRVLGLLSPK